LKRRELIRKITKLGAKFIRHGGNHDIYEKGNDSASVPRHTEVDEELAHKIIKFFLQD